ncbi:site-specific integrase [Psychrobacter immobilis]|uniref:site-specific integrase n=1 Tax=Psychrobacter immobilis TaxID=498 RepID=UPI0019181B39|nr:site-specific integrase [Psychrobacter immobilis]
MTQNNDTSPSQEEWLSAKTINHLKSDKAFVYPESVVEAISTIVIAVHDSYKRPENSTKYLIETIAPLLQQRPVANQYMQINRTDLAQKPLMMQLLILMQDIVSRQRLNHSSRLIWMAIALHTAALLMVPDRKTDTNNILMQFKMAQFSAAPRRVWLWPALPDIKHIDMSIERILSVFNSLLEQQKSALATINNKQTTHTEEMKVAKNKTDAKAKLSQIEKITTAYQNAHALRKPKPKRKKPPKNIKIKAINLADNTSTIPLDSTATSHNWNTTPSNDAWGNTRDDIEHSAIAIDLAFLEANTESYEGLTTSFEECIDHYEAPYISYGEYPNPLIKNSIPLQTIDLSLQQNYMSQRNLALNSNTRLLSLVGYQALFAALNQDASTLLESETHKTCAGILLLSMITGLPVKSLLTPGYIGHPGIFNLEGKKYYIKHSLGITERSTSQTLAEKDYENHSDTIKVPLPSWLIDNLLACQLPVKEDFTAYLANLRSSLGLPYLSVNRIETALHIVLSRYTPDCHQHIADIICRTPAPHAPAMYYSSHTSEALITNYKSALSVFSSTSSFDLSYISLWRKYTVGSGFALKIETVCDIINEMRCWTDQSLNDEDHFNRTGIFVWFIFCLLTGVRPNNGLGKMYDIDLDMGWLLINDKPVKKVKSDRLIPLCSTLVKHLIDYRAYLIDYQAKHQSNHVISATIDDIRLGNDEALLKLLSERAPTFNATVLKDIKRGDAYQTTKHIIDANPYWTRHFVRTQLEKLGVSLSLINTVIGHEKARQEVLGRFSSSSKADIKRVASVFEQIAAQLGLSDITINNYPNSNHVGTNTAEVDHANK